MPLIKRNKKPKKRIFLTIINILIITLILSVVITAGLTFFIINKSIANLPDIDTDNINFAQNSIMLDNEGQLLSTVHTGSLRTVVKYEDISKDMINAIIAIEDKTFWKHKGFNYVRLIGAVKDGLLGGGEISGTSTLTQQLARNLFLTDKRFERSIVRKIQEAYYSMQIEEKMPKEKIIESYLNTVYLGASADGIEAASNIYFGKTSSELNYIESAILASIPKAPSYYEPLNIVDKKDLSKDDQVIGNRDSTYVYVYNTNIEERFKYVLKLMYEQEYITKEEYDNGINTNIVELLKPAPFSNSKISTYFADMCFKQVVEDLAKEKDITEDEAENFLLTAGLRIYSTLDTNEQNILERNYMDEGGAEYFNSGLASTVIQYQSDNGIDADGTIGPNTWASLIEKGYFKSDQDTSPLQEGDTDKRITDLKKAFLKEGYAAYNPSISGIMITFVDDKISVANSWLYNYRTSFTRKGEFLIPNTYYTTNSNGDYVVEPTYYLDYYKSDDGYISLILGDMYDYRGNSSDRNDIDYGTYYLDYILLYQNAALNLPQDYLSIDSNGNIVISKNIITDKLATVNEFNELQFNSNNCFVPDIPIVQPQSAAALIDHNTGYLKAVVGGRNLFGNALFNRAATPTQTGSSIKPLAVYAPAIDSGIASPATTVVDKPTYEFNPASSSPWPVNFDGSYRGVMTLRSAIVNSQNVPAVKFLDMVGFDRSISYLEKNGVTSIVKDGDATDRNYAALALGALTYGISPVEMASAYGTFGNEGVHIPWKTYTKVTDQSGNVILDNTSPVGETVFTPEANYIMTDLLDDVVIRYANEAQIRYGNSGIPVIGKTGTSGAQEQNVDAWFNGLTPYRTLSLWVGSDRIISLEKGSWFVAQFWSEIMSDLHVDKEDASFASKPDGVVYASIDSQSGLLPSTFTPSSSIISDLFISGSVPTRVDDSRTQITVCNETGKKATSFCPNVSNKIIFKYESSGYGTCNVHTSAPPPPKPETSTEPTPKPEPKPEPEPEPDPDPPVETSTESNP